MTQIIFLTTLLSVWQNPTLVYVGPGDQEIDVVISDGEGGAAVIWWDDLTEWNFMQVIDSEGNLKWDAEGVPIIANASLSTQNPDVFLDDDGNYWVALEGNEDIYVQKISPTGQRLFGDEGVAVCNEETEESYPRLCPSGDGAIITWLDYRSRSLMDLIFAQRVVGDGSTKWTENGIQICDSTTNQPQRFADPVPDGDNGAIIILDKWHYIESFDFVYAQRLDSLGYRIWGDTGIFVNRGAFDARLRPTPTGFTLSDGYGGSVFFYWDRSTLFLYQGRFVAQRIDSSGTLLWGAPGIQILNTFGRFSSISNDNIYLARPGFVAGLNMSVHVNRLTLDGITPWGDTGITAWQVDAESPTADILPDICENGITVWRDVGDESGWYDERGVLAQRVDTLGSVLWTEEVLVCGLSGNEPCIVSTHDKSGVVVWQDVRNQNVDLYATMIDSLGNLPPGIEETNPNFSLPTLELDASIVSDQVRLRYSLPEEENGAIQLFDASGRLVKSIVTNRSTGSVSIETNQLPVGVYFARLSVVNSKITAGVKIVLLR